MEILEGWLSSLGISETMLEPATVVLAALGTVVLMVISNFVTRRILLRLVEGVVARTSTRYDDALVEQRFFHRIAHLAPALVLHLSAPFAFAPYPRLVEGLETAAFLYMALVAVSVAFALLDTGLRIYSGTPLATRLPLKPIIQAAKFLAIFAAVLVGISTLIGKSPAVLLSGLGAFTAILILVFREPILGLVAGMQLVSNDMVRPGDWISVPRFDADGSVIDVSLTTVSVQNWDKTISSIPNYSLLTDTFRNWRGMQNSGGRRIKRSVNIDVSSIHFCDEDELEDLKKIQFVQEHIDQKRQEIGEFNREKGVDESLPINGRRLTNVGIFRAYLEAYLRSNPQVHEDMTFLVRQLQPSGQGLPIEIYVFSRDQRWAHYEAIQADIFDHVLAAVPLFGLRVFQEPSGADLRSLAGGRRGPDGDAATDPERGRSV